MKPIYIFDLDGTLALIEHRRWIIGDSSKDNSKWRRFYSECDKDTPNEPVIKVMESLRRFADILIFSGRSSEVRGKTVDWLTKHTTFMADDLDVSLIMRDEGDYTADYILKKKWLDGMLMDDRKRVLAVFDDRDSVVAMWRNCGLTCFQVASGNF